MSSNHDLPQIGRPVSTPNPVRFGKLSKYSILTPEALVILRKHEATKHWGIREIGIIFDWMESPGSLETHELFDRELEDKVRAEQVRFAELFAVGSDIMDPLLEIRTMIKGAMRSKVKRAAMVFGQMNDLCKTGDAEYSEDLLKRFWTDKAEALVAELKCTILGDSCTSARDIENLRDYLRKLVRDFPRE